MKKNNRTFFPNVDYRIYICFGGLLLVSFLLLLYQFTRHVDCDDARFFVHADEYIINSVVEFQDNTEGAKSWEWDFGDSTAVDKRQVTFHKYSKPGNYLVRLKINNNCVHEKMLTITSISQETGYLPVILSPNVVAVGESIRFGAEKDGGESWEWSFGETSNTDALGKNPSYTFKSVGEKKITLIVNGDIEHTAVKTIYVAPKTIKAKQKIDIRSYEFEKSAVAFSLPRGAAQKDPLVDMLQYIPVSPRSKSEKDSIISEKKAPEISNEQLQLLLNQVSAQLKTKDDFKDYLCGNFEIPVIINDKKLLPFDQFCQNITGKKIKISALRFTKNSKNCIQNITIQYKVKKLMVWVKE
ncbi:PKD domain-containing protein [Chryseobacterium soldanellicola]|uniref:PKD domain-containing protein n=1 Tax=Chryseobacterium soldanellicola TaxID=311333 RepID=A0A1H0YQB8_9FLAO|nr:PKD domain-containing protein [Chryseobacterium soldanellicola]SDQ17268.1 PKD domain-containing protein [Chryseobacterium soldanellicola]